MEDISSAYWAKLIKMPPEAFQLRADVIGIHKVQLNWMETAGADNYSVYRALSPDVNESDILHEYGLTNNSIIIEGLDMSTYYFRVLAYNEIGTTWSNELSVTLQLSSEENDDDNDNDNPEMDIAFLDLIIILSSSGMVGAGICAYILMKRKRQKSLAI